MRRQATLVPSFSGAETYDAVEPLHEGARRWGAGDPVRAPHPRGRVSQLGGSSTSQYGELAWSIVIESDIAAGLDTITTHSIPIDADAKWTGPEPTGERKTEALVKKWDVAVEPERWALRRGDELNFALRIGKPKAERPKLEVALQCQLYYQSRPRTLASPTGARSTTSTWSRGGPSSTRRSPSRRSR